MSGQARGSGPRTRLPLQGFVVTRSVRQLKFAQHPSRCGTCRPFHHVQAVPFRPWVPTCSGRTRTLAECSGPCRLQMLFRAVADAADLRPWASQGWRGTGGRDPHHACFASSHVAFQLAQPFPDGNPLPLRALAARSQSCLKTKHVLNNCPFGGLPFPPRT